MKECRLADVATIDSGAGFPIPYQGTEGQEFPFLKVSDMNLSGNEREILRWNHSVSAEVRGKLRAKAFPAGSLIFPKIGAAIGTNKKRQLTRPSCVDNNVMAAVPNGNLLEADFLYFLFLTKNLSDFASDSNPPSIRKSDVEDWNIRVPSLPEQRRIVDILSRAESIVRLRREAQRKAVELIPALFTDLFGDPATNPKGWPVQPLNQLVKFVGGATPSKSREDFWEGDLPWVSPKDMKRLEISDAEDHLDAKVLSETNLKLIPANSILVVVRGMILAHSLPLAITRSPVTINQDMKAFTPLGRVEPDYLFWALMASKGTLQNKIDAAAHGTKKLDTEHLVNLNIPIPPRSLQVAWADKARAVASIQSQQATATTQAEATFNALLAQVFAPV